NRSRRHIDLRHSAAAASTLAHVDQPFCRSNDALRRRTSGHVPDFPPRAPVADVLAVSLSKHDGNLAAVSQPFDVGRLRGFDLRHGLRDVLVCRSDSRLRYAARSRSQQTVSDSLRHARNGLARICSSLASLRDGLPATRGTGHATRFVSTHDRQFRLRRRHHSGMARDDISAVLRRRRDLRRLRDGVVADDSAAKVLWPRRLHHHAPHAQHGEGDARHRIDRRLRLHHGSVLRLVQRQQVRTLHDLEPHAWSLSPLLLGFDSLQHHHAAVSVVQESAFEPAGTLDHFVHREHRHVARAFRDRRDKLASRLPADVVGNVPAHAVGLEHVYRHDRVLLYAAVSVYSLPANDLDFRDAHDPAGSGGGGIGWRGMDSDGRKLEQPIAAGHEPLPGHRRHAPPLYGVIAEFENPTDVVAAARQVYHLGYRRINGYSPYPIE